MDMDDVPTETAPSSLWPLASSPERARCATQAVERYLHMVRIVMTRVAAWPAGERPFQAPALDLARQLYEMIGRRVDELGRPPRPDVLCAHCSAMSFLPYPPVHDDEACTAICDTCGIVGLVGASGWWGVPARTGS